MEEEFILSGLNLTFDYIKHITTLSTGLIVIIATLLEKVFTKPKYKFLIVLCILALGLSLVGSLIYLGQLSTWLMYHSIFNWPESELSVGFWLSVYGFYGALALFIIFTLLNFGFGSNLWK
jgi:hypothetical protein